MSAAKYNENPGWMEYAGNPVNGLMTILPAPVDPAQILLPLYGTHNFTDGFVHAPAFRVYGFDNRVYESPIPKDPEAPLPSVISANRPEGTTSVQVTVPSIFNTYVLPHVSRTFPPAIASSGLDIYRFPYASPPVLESHQDKCTQENNNCGISQDTGQGETAVSQSFELPSNYNSKVVVNRTNREEQLYINGVHVATTPGHYEILAVYGNTAVVRETTAGEHQEISLPYWHQSLNERVYDDRWHFAAKYAVYSNGVRYDLPGATTIRSHYLTTRTEAAPDWSTVSPVRTLTYDIVDDIIGLHIDRIFINESFDKQHILVAYDEYAYNNGEGLVHELKYGATLSDGTGWDILYYDIAASKLQYCDHDAVRTGRKLLLFKSDGTLEAQLADPIGLDKKIGSIGILN